jgi:hypothetical protein
MRNGRVLGRQLHYSESPAVETPNAIYLFGNHYLILNGLKLNPEDLPFSICHFGRLGFLLLGGN